MVKTSTKTPVASSPPTKRKGAPPEPLPGKKKKSAPVIDDEEEPEEDEELEEESDLPLFMNDRDEESEAEEEEEEEEEESPRSRHPSKQAKAAHRDGHGPKSSSKKSSRPTLDIGDTMAAEDWQRILEQVSGSGGLFYFVKEGKTRLRLVAEPGSKNRWFIETESTFKGATRSKMIALAVLQSGKGVTEDMKSKVTPIVLSKTVVKSILALLAEGYNLLSPTKGYGITISRNGAALDTTYNVLPSQEPRPLPEKLEWPEIRLLSELADEYESNQQKRDSQRKGGNNGGDEEDEDW